MLMNAAEIGLQVASARRLAGVTQAELADKLGTTQSALSRVEAGRVLPRIDFLDRLARELGQPLVLTLGTASRPSADRAERVRRALGEFKFDPWQRSPSAAERRSLESDGLTREHFRRTRSASPGRDRT
jgi:transcriptional regulator with XRE-family HTH domain